MNKILSDEEIDMALAAMELFKLRYSFNEKYMSFLKVLTNHPEFFWGFKEKADELREHGVETHSAMTILGVLRYESALRLPNEGWKINNNHAKPLRILLEIFDDSFVGLFKDRKPKGQQKLVMK